MFKNSKGERRRNQIGVGASETERRRSELSLRILIRDRAKPLYGLLFKKEGE